MSLELTTPLLSVGMLAAIASGQPYDRDEIGYEYVPSSPKKRPPMTLRLGRFTRQRAACRRGMARRFYAANADVCAPRPLTRFPRAVAPSLAAWRTSTKATQFGILGAAFGALSMRKRVS